MTAGKGFLWTRYPGDVRVRDDRLRREFGSEDLASLRYEHQPGLLRLEKRFTGAPWTLTETYTLSGDAIAWESSVALDQGDFRSCAVTYHVPWPQPLHSMKFWAARYDMPSEPYRFASLALEYGEVTSGILMPALCSYLEQPDAGLLVTMPFDFRTPRFRFVCGLRDPDLEMEFDWLALAPGHNARTSLLFRGTGGAWRPALGWLYERFREYFVPRSRLIHNLWGGHVSGGCDVSAEEAAAMADLGLKWHEIHVHFPAYGNYHPEGLAEWRSGHARESPAAISVETIRRTIRNLHGAGSAALPYIQVTGDGDDHLLDPAFEADRIRDLHGDRFCAWPGTTLLNSDPSLAFGRDMTRQIAGMVARYPEMDGVFADQLCYNQLDTAHDDGLTAVNNRPAYMLGFNYFPHLEHLSALLHPAKAIIGNGPYAIGIMKYVDGFMAEGSGWLCDHFQYYGLEKPMYFLMYQSGDRDIELMFQRCLIYGAGYTSYAKAAPSRDLYRLYVPLLEKLFRRRWVFDANPIELPTGFAGNVFRGPAGALLASVVSTQPRLGGRTLGDNSIRVRAAGVERVRRISLTLPGTEPADVAFGREDGALQFALPGDLRAGVAELRAD
jgi:hypothetical protein